MFILDTDASHVGIGAVLSQMVDGRECVLAYFSKVLTKPERRRGTAHGNAYALSRRPCQHCLRQEGREVFQVIEN